MTNAIRDNWKKAKAWCKENRPQAICLAIIFAVILLLAILKIFDTNRYINKSLGYEIKGPSDWQMIPSKDKRSVAYKKYKKENYASGNATIRMKVEYGNPYGETALDYVVNGLLPQVEYTYERGEGKKIHLREEPYTVRHGNIEWATLSFLLDYTELQMVFVTTVNDNVYILALNSTSQNQREDERLFIKTVKTVRLKHLKRKNPFLEKDAPLF